jgi:glycerol 3-phosphatase-2
MTKGGSLSTSGHPLRGTDQALAKIYDVALLDLDGVVYRGEGPVTHAASALAEARKVGMRLAFVTNNALRPPDEVARRVTAAGVPADPGEVATSAQAAARLLTEQLPAGSKVLVSGGAGLRRAVSERGFVPVSRADEHPAAVVSGFDPELTYARLTEAVQAIFAGASWVASNTDVTIPTERGLLPGAGALVAFIAAATKMQPQVAGKPERALHEEAMSRSGAQRPLVVGDRLDTDIEGANGVGAPSLLVLTGVTSLAELVKATVEQRPTYLGSDLRALLRQAPSVHRDGHVARCGGWRCSWREGELEWTGASAEGDDGLDAFRAGVVLVWALVDAGKGPVGVRGQPPAGCEAFALDVTTNPVG